MKVCIALLGVAALVTLLSTGAASVSNAPGGMTAVSDAEAAALFGGDCNPATTKTCNGAYYGCQAQTGKKLLPGSGSWQVDTTVNCGVQECGTVVTVKSCEG